MDRPVDAAAPDDRSPGVGAGRAGHGLRVAIVGMPWPVETFVDRLLRGLAGRGHHLTVVSGSRPSSVWLTETGSSWRPGPDRPGPRRSARLALDALRRERTTAALGVLARGSAGPAALRGHDVVYAPWINALTEHPALFDPGVPVVTSCRGSLISVAPWNPRRRAHREALGEVFRRATAVHCVSEAILHDAVALGLSPERAVVIRPAVDPDVYASAPRAADGVLRVLAVGSLDWRKSYEHALVAVAAARRHGADVRLRIIGAGADEQHLRYAIDDLALGGAAELIGRRAPAEVAAELRRADAFIHTSSAEGISNAVLEAMAAGLPVITTAAGGMAEAVRDDVDGFVVAVRDTDAMARRLGELAGDPSLRERLGTSARRRIETSFRLSDQIDAFDRLLRSAAGP